MTTATASARGLRGSIPSLGWRLAGAAALLFAGLLFLVVLPAVALGMLATHSIAPPLPVATLAAFGTVVAILFAGRYAAKPTAAYGPLTILAALVEIAYLGLLYADATFRIALPEGTISIGYARLIALLLVVPILTLAAGVVTTIEDARAPGERLPYDFPT